MELLDGCYELGKLRACDLLGCVYEAVDRRSGSMVFVRLIQDTIAEDSQWRNWVQKAADRARGRTLDGVVPVIATSVSGDAAYVVMEYRQGRTYQELFDMHGIYTPQESLPYLGKAAGMLDSLSERGAVFGTLTASSFLVCNDGNVCILGLPLIAENEPLRLPAKLACEGPFSGPEVVAGEGITGASDEYTLAVLARQMLTGTPGPGAERKLPRSAQAALAISTSDAPSSRFGNCGEFVCAIAGYRKVINLRRPRVTRRVVLISALVAAAAAGAFCVVLSLDTAFETRISPLYSRSTPNTGSEGNQKVRPASTQSVADALYRQKDYTGALTAYADLYRVDNTVFIYPARAARCCEELMKACLASQQWLEALVRANSTCEWYQRAAAVPGITESERTNARASLASVRGQINRLTAARVKVCSRSGLRATQYCRLTQQLMLSAAEAPKSFCSTCAPQEPSWVTVRVCSKSLKRPGSNCAKVVTRQFRAGKAPKTVCTQCKKTGRWLTVWVCSASGKQWKPGCPAMVKKKFRPGRVPSQCQMH
jgi:serine/threonine protein kinase